MMPKPKTHQASPEELVREAREWDSRVQTPAGWTDAPEAVPRSAVSKTISVRVPDQMLATLKEFARREGIGYQVLMKRWLDDRIRKERDSLEKAQTEAFVDKGRGLDEMNRALETLNKIRSIFAESGVTEEELLEEGRRVRQELARKQTPRVVSAHSFFSAPSPDLETLARQQGVKPVADMADLRGDFWPEEEDPDEFVNTIRQWRREGGDA